MKKANCPSEIVTAVDALTSNQRLVRLKVVDMYALACAWREVDKSVTFGPAGALEWYMRTGEILAGCEVEDEDEDE